MNDSSEAVKTDRRGSGCRAARHKRREQRERQLQTVQGQGAVVHCTLRQDSCPTRSKIARDAATCTTGTSGPPVPLPDRTGGHV